MKTHLNKADYQRFVTCPTAAFYGWQALPSKNDDDPFWDFLADEGKIVGQAAKRLFRDAVEIAERHPEQAMVETKEAIKTESKAIYEGCATYGSFLARPDVLIREGNRLYLIEVKSKVGDMRAHLDGRMLINMYGDIRAAWKDYVSDLAFQVHVFAQAFPDYEIVPYFLLPEGGTLARAEEVDAVQAKHFDADGLNDTEMRKRRAGSVLKFFPAKKAIDHIRDVTELKMAEMEQVWISAEKPTSPLKYQCRNCEFRLNDGRDSADGFHRCWGELAKPNPHIFDLNQLYSLKTSENRQALLADQKISEGSTSLYDVHEEELHGEHATRQQIQLPYQRAGTEWIDPELRTAMDGLTWPIAFLDFETSMAAIPWYSGMKPYDVIPFQFSAHIVEKDSSWEHTEWLNTEDRSTTLEFIRQLRNALENTGSILVFTDYEIRVLRDAIGYLLRQDYDTTEEREWISELLSSGRIVDQHQWVHDWYFHPMMGGKTSIKKVMPAVWTQNQTLHAHPYFKRYFSEIEEGIVNPYKTLPARHIAGLEWEVREGCAAMKTYREMIRGIGKTDPAAKSQLADLLREYVTLDTASQWMIFDHWRQHFGL